MKKHLNTLFVTTQGAYLAKDGETVAVRVENDTKLRVPIHTLEGVVCFGNVGCSPFLMGFCAEKNVIISFLTEQGRFLARIAGPINGNVLLRRQQYRLADDQRVSVRIARCLVGGKIANSRTVLQRALRDRPDSSGAESLRDAISHLKMQLERVMTIDDLDEIRGMEGDAAHSYFQVFDHLISSQKDDFVFHQRSRRPPLDNCNALMSFLYTLVMHDITGALEAVGLDPAVGFLHRDRPGRPGLALDLMEEFRSVIADRLTLSLINLNQIQGDGFQTSESGAIRMTDDTRKAVLVAYQKRKQDEITHPFIGETMSLGLVFHIQARLLARYIRGDLDAYPPFIWK